MTNAELIAKIRAEIERRKKSLRAGICNEEVFTRKQRKEMLVASEELDRFNRFLSDLEKSEKPMEQEGLEEEIDRVWKQCNPIDEGMGVESTYMHIEAFNIIARHFAEWCAKHLKK